MRVAKDLEHLSKPELIELVVEMCSVSVDTTKFCEARLGCADVIWYKSQVQHSVWPDLMEREDFDLERTSLLLGAFSKATRDPAAAIDLMLYAVEQGNQFTLEYGDIDAGFYEGLEEILSDALEMLEQCPECFTREVGDRLRKISDQTAGIGWGYHDALAGMVSEFLTATERPDSQDTQPPLSEAELKAAKIEQLEERLKMLLESP